MDETSESMLIDIIINSFMNNPDLYEKSDPQYINVFAKKEKLEKIAQYCQELNINITVPEIIKKWQSLVAQFRKCLAKENSCTTGSAPTENTFTYFEDMMFLKPSLQHLKPLTSLTVHQVDNKVNRKNKFDYTSTVPEYDDFAKKKKKKLQQDDDVFAEVSNKMLKTFKAVQNNLESQVSQTSSINYTNILAQAFSKVPDGYEDDCLMHVLQELEEFDNITNKN